MPSGVDRVEPLTVCMLELLLDGFDVPGWESCILLENDVAVQLLDFGGLTPKGT